MTTSPSSSSSPSSSTHTRPSTILVTGGTGKTGRRVAALLNARGIRARVASRRSADGPDAVRFDWADETTWPAALDGVRAVYLVDSQTPTAPAELRAFTELAAAHGVERVVLLSARVLAEVGDPAWLATEDAIREGSVPWTILRPTWFIQNFLEEPLIVGAVSASADELRMPTGEGREPFIDAEDIAEAAVAALTGEGHAGQTYELSGPEALTWGEAVAEIARATGRALRFTPVDDEEALEVLTAAGWPREFVEQYLPLLAHIRHGRSATLSDGVQRLLGRAPGSVAAYTERVAKETA
ncbi:NAD(P)H-binding protein [Streptomyces sp. UNOC14_S4]|uniref:NAD(P)H-binding protein n=1 Tax=Streptomyces sp. UNOC14_S4 TaxID=2872340 RepID=UPI001E3BB72D|nr:NAD(P)H-binding protein [Streptomyces sp. UNOC14_S4]MCC3766840.1 NAD(P)H-binding protein [Streptomyces sp. UNOC14_S4]